MPPPRRRPATPPPRRTTKVAGLRRPAAQPEGEDVLDPADTVDTADSVDIVEEVPQLDVPVIGETDDRPRPQPKRRDSGTVADDSAPVKHRRRRVKDPEPDETVGVEDEGDEGVAEPAEDVASEEEFDDEEFSYEEVTEDNGPQVKILLPMVLVVAALLLGALSWFFATKAADSREGANNAALVDVNGTKDLVGAAQQAVAGVLSYKYDQMDQAKIQAQQYLSGEAVDQYNKSMQALASQIQSQKLQVAVNPVSVGVVRLAGDDARVLVFADQIGVRADNQPSGGPTQFAMDMHRTNGKWKIVKLDFFDGK
ncbi:hypothetical protein [Actinocrispum wychmicini]|uniref:Mce-associated membrane protein n=1 Tax=Actinocrispum wychmicini TaxID=1213861 RepID=A0A4R2JXL0_9PSEU|nr:hypothetical protein [Actinocrispum wychmicini]TCO65321.1 Mce-associated membrane protein [Actinocrispum wychmicini]